MKCLSCKRDVASRTATLWQKRVFLCKACCDLADAAKAELDAAAARAALQSMMFLEQHILRGGLLQGAPSQALTTLSPEEVARG